jgi:hypothetical protein
MNIKFLALSSAWKHRLDKAMHAFEQFLMLFTAYCLTDALYQTSRNSHYTRPGRLEVYWEPTIEYIVSLVIQGAIFSTLMLFFSKYRAVCFFIAEVASDVVLISMKKG